MALGQKKTRAPKPERLAGIQVQSSVYGKPIPLVYGTARVSPNLIWYGGFRADSVVSKTKTGGKGGGGQSVSETYSYKAAIMLGVARGPIAGVRRVWRDKNRFVDGASTALSQAGLSLATGTDSQSPWGYLSTAAPSESLNYPGLAYAYASSYQLTDSAGLMNHTFEVVSNIRRGSGAGADDADPAAILPDLLGRVPGWRSGLIASLTDYNNYCVASGLWLSPAIDAEQSAAAIIEQILRATNSDARWSGGQLQILPRGDIAVSGNGASWSPNLTPVYDLDLSTLGDEDGEPIVYEIDRGADAYNQIEIEYLDRSRDYAETTIRGIDPAAIDAFGLRKSDPEQMSFICDGDVAAKAAQNLVARTSILKRRFSVRLPATYSLIEAGDYLTLTFDRLGLSRQLVRVLEYTEDDDDGEVGLSVEEVLVGAAPALIVPQPMSGYRPNYDALPGAALSPVVIAPPRQLTEGALEMWIGSSGGADWGGAEVWLSFDGSTYERRGQIQGKARYGTTTSSLAAVADPHVGGSVGVNISAAGGTLDGATTAEADAFATLCLIGDEVVAYRDSALTASGRYTLSYLRRGLFGTSPAATSSGARFVRLDGALASIPFAQTDIGKTIYIKLQSFNVYGRAYQDLADVSATTAVVGQSGALFVSPGSGVIIGTNVLAPDRSLLPAGRIDNFGVTIDSAGRIVGIGTSDIFVANSAIKKTDGEIAELNSEIVAGRGTYGSLNARLSAIASSSGDWNTLANRPLTLAELDATASTTLYSLSSEVVAARGSSGSLGARISAESLARADGDSALAGRASSLEAVSRAGINISPALSTWTAQSVGTESAVPNLATIGSNGAAPLTDENAGGPKKLWEIAPGRVYEVVADIGITNAGDGSLKRRIVAVSHNDAGAGTSGSPTTAFAGPTVGATGRAVIVGRFSTTGVGGSTVFADPSTVRRVRFLAGVAEGGSSQACEVFSLSVRDISSQVDAEARILSVETVNSTQDGAIASISTEVSAARSGEANLSARLSSIVAASASADSVLAGRITVTESQLGGTTSSNLGSRITTAESSLTTLTSTVASQGTELAAARGGEANLAARLGTLNQARIDGDAALSSRTSLIEAARRFPIPDAISRNPTFSVWSGGSATRPDDWEDWSNGASNTKETGDVSPYAYRQAKTSGSVNWGMKQTLNGRMTQGWYVLEADIRLNSGSLVGSGLYFQYGASGGATNSDLIGFAVSPDIDGTIIGAGTAGRRYRFSKLISLVNVANIAELYLMTSWEGLSGASGDVKDITWHKALIRPATQGEIDAKVAKETTIPTTVARIAAEEAARVSGDSALASQLTTLSAQFVANPNLFPYPNPITARTPTQQGWTGTPIGSLYVANLGGMIYYKARGSGGAAVTEAYEYALPDAVGISSTSQYTLTASGYAGTASVGDRIYMVLYVMSADGSTVLHSTPGVVLNSGDLRTRYKQTTNWTGGYTVCRLKVVFFREWPASGSYQDVVFSNIKLEAGTIETAFNTSAQVNINANAIATVNDSAAFYQVLVAASGGDPALIRLFSGLGGSEVAIASKIISLVNTSSGAAMEVMRAVGGLAFFRRPISSDAGGRRVTIGPGFGVSGSEVVLWFGPDSLAPDAQSRTNGYFALGTDGRIYYGSAELTPGAAGGRQGRATTANGIGSGSWADIVTVSLGNAAAGFANFLGTDYTPFSFAGGATSFQLRLVRDSTVLWTSTAFEGIDGSGFITTGWIEASQAMSSFIGTVSGGAATYKLQGIRTAGSGSISTASAVLNVVVNPS